MNFWHLLAACQAVWFLVASARRDVELEPIATAFLPRLLRVARIGSSKGSSRICVGKSGGVMRLRGLFS